MKKLTLLASLVLVSSLGQAQFTNLVSLGSTGYLIDAEVTTAEGYAQNASGIRFNPSVNLGHTLGGAFIDGPLDWSSFSNLSSSIYLKITFGETAINPLLPISLELFNSDFSLSNTYSGTTTPIAQSTGYFKLALVGTFIPAVLADVAGVQITWDGGGSINAQVEAVSYWHEPWKWIEPLPQGNALSAAATDGQTLVAVGNFGTILTKPANGGSWQTVDTSHLRPIGGENSDGTLSNIVWTGQRFIVSSLFQDGLLASSNGRDWAVIPKSARLGVINFDSGWNATVPLACIGDTIVGIETRVTYHPNFRVPYITSTNHGETWTQGWLPPIPRLRGQNQYEVPPYTTLVAHKDLFIAGGGNGMIATSGDGVQWTRRGAGVTSSVIKYLASNGQVVAAVAEGSWSYQHQLLYSADGINWFKADMKQIRDQLKNPYYDPGDPYINSIFSDGEQLVAQISGSTFTSADGSSWTKQDSSSVAPITWMGRLSGKTYFLDYAGGIGQIGEDGNLVMEVGTDEVTQHFRGNPSVAELGDVAVAVSWDLSSGAYAKITADKQVSSEAFFVNYSPKAVFRVGNHLIAAATHDNSAVTPTQFEFFRSTDAVSWEPAGSGFFPGDTLELVGASTESGPLLMASTETTYDSQTWGSTTTMRLYRTSQGLTGWNEIEAPGNTAPIIAVPPGTTPPAGYSLPPISSLEPSIEWDGQRFILKNTAGELWVSIDGLEWSKLPPLPADSRNFLLASGNFWGTVDDSNGEMEKNYAGYFASNGQRLVVRPAKLYFDTYNYNNNGQVSPRWRWHDRSADVFYVYDFANGTDGTWTRVLKPPLNQYSGRQNDVIWTGKNFITTSGDAGVILTSPDGFQWTRRELRAQVDSVHPAGSRLVALTSMGGALVHPDGLSEAADEKQQLQDHGMGLFVAGFDEAIHLYEITDDGQTTVDQAPRLKDARNRPISFAGLASMVGGLMTFFFEEEPIPVPLPSEPEMAVESVEGAPRERILSFPDFNLRTGAFLGVRRIQVNLENGVVIPLSTLAASQLAEILASENRLDADFNADGVIGDATTRNLGGGLYFTASGALFYSAQLQTMGQPIRNALMLRDTRGNPLKAASLARGFDLMQQAGGSIGSLTSEGTLRAALPNYVLPRGASTPVFTGLTVHDINASSGRIKSTTIVTSARQLAALLAAEAEFAIDFNRDGVTGDAVVRDLGGGVYTTGSGALYVSTNPQSLGQPVQNALMLRDARGNPLAQGSFAPRNELIQAASSSIGRSQENGVLTLAVPHFTTASRIVGMNPTDQPAMPRFNHSQVWTGEKLIVWGGSYWTDNTQTTTEVYQDGGIYDPAADTWEPINTTDPDTPNPRAGHTAVWADGKMIVWGGSGAKATDSDGGLAWDEYNDGGIYDPATGSWEPINTTDPDAPTPRVGHTAVWTGDKMVVWGGVFEANGAIYDPANDADPWSPLDTLNAPQARVGHGAVVAGGRMAIWGGSVESTSYENSAWQGSGAFYDYASGEWESISTLNAPWGGEGWWAEDGERGVEILWTGSRMIALPINSLRNGRWVHPGGSYDPDTGIWEPLSTAGAPNARPYMAAITQDGSLFAAGSSRSNFAGLVYNFGSKRWSQVMRGVTGSFQGRRGTWAPELGEMLVFGGMWANTSSPFSGGAAGNRGFRLQVNKPVFSSLSLNRFDMATGRLISSSRLTPRQMPSVLAEETNYGIDFNGDGKVGGAP